MTTKSIATSKRTSQLNHATRSAKTDPRARSSQGRRQPAGHGESRNSPRPVAAKAHRPVAGVQAVEGSSTPLRFRARFRNQCAATFRAWSEFFDGFDTAKGLVTFGFTTAGLLGLLFLADLLFAWPFMRASANFSAAMVVCAAILGLLSRDVASDLRRR